MNYREKIRKSIECPQFANATYGEWGMLNLTQRKYIKRLLDELDSADNYLKKVYLENQKLNKKYLNAVADYETTMFEKEQLNSLVNSCQEEIRQLKKQLENKYSRTGTLTNEVLYEENTKLINQQKKFIEYLEYQVKLQEELNDIHLATGFEEILSKYKEIIGLPMAGLDALE